MKKVCVPFFISHRGCPNRCVFCDQRTITGCAGDLPTSDGIAARILAWRRTSGSRPMEVAFFGGTFTALPTGIQDTLLEAVRPFILSGAVSSIRLSTRPDALDRDRVQWLAERGVGTIEVGVQSMDDGVLTASGRGHDAESSVRALGSIRSGGLSAGAQLMPGLPGDTPSLSRYSLERVIAAGADFVRLYPVVVLRGTELADRYSSGRYTPLSVAGGVALCKVLAHTALRSAVPVIRMGLQADAGLREENIVAGCWHPAFGDLVYGELFFDLLLRIGAEGGFSRHQVTVGCHPARVSNVVGHGRRNIGRLREHGIVVERVTPDADLSPHECEMVAGGKRVRGSVIDDL